MREMKNKVVHNTSSHLILSIAAMTEEQTFLLTFPNYRLPFVTDNRTERAGYVVNDSRLKSYSKGETLKDSCFEIYDSRFLNVGI